MDLATAQRHITDCLGGMQACYLQSVFDEWAILSLRTDGSGIVAYDGPRPDQFRRQLPHDVEPLRMSTQGKQLAEGDIEFVTDATKTRYDALMKIGASSYLILNHTKKTLAEIRSDTKWLGAQAVLFALTEKFRVDPLELD